MNIDELYDKIYRYCYFKLGSRESAEDITQEAFLRFLEAHGYTESGKSLQYIYTIARNLCIDEFRRNKQTEPSKSGGRKAELGFEHEFEPPDPLDTADEVATSVTVREALARLDESERELLLLAHVNEVPRSVLASLYGSSRFALRRRLKLAEKKLKALLE